MSIAIASLRFLILPMTCVDRQRWLLTWSKQTPNSSKGLTPFETEPSPFQVESEFRSGVLVRISFVKVIVILIVFREMVRGRLLSFLA